jgi:hypothetical protein
MKVVSEEIDSRLTEIGPRHIGTFDEYFSTSLMTDQRLHSTELFPVTIAKYTLKDGFIIEFIDLYIPEHRLVFFGEFLELCHTLIIFIFLEKSTDFEGIFLFVIAVPTPLSPIPTSPLLVVDLRGCAHHTR